MSRPRGILDTIAVLELPTLATSGLLPDIPLITAVTLAELSVGPLVAADPSERARRQALLQQVETDFEPPPFGAAARAFGIVAADLRRAGRITAARSYDAMIAAVAMSRGLPLYTCDATDFLAVTGLEAIPVPPS